MMDESWTAVVLVTGAAGRLGGRIAQRLLSEYPKCRVIGTDLAAQLPAWAEGQAAERLVFVPAVNLTDAAAVGALFDRSVTHCVHVAAWPGPSKQAPLSTMRRNDDADFKIGLEDATPEQVLLETSLRPGTS